MTNDLCFTKTEIGELALHDWIFENSIDEDIESNVVTESTIQQALVSLQQEDEIVGFILEIAEKLSNFDWRSASAENLSEEEKTTKLVFRGSGGYRELRRQLLKYLIEKGGEVGRIANIAYLKLGFE